MTWTKSKVSVEYFDPNILPVQSIIVAFFVLSENDML